VVAQPPSRQRSQVLLLVSTSRDRLGPYADTVALTSAWIYPLVRPIQPFLFCDGLCIMEAGWRAERCLRDTRVLSASPTSSSFSCFGNIEMMCPFWNGLIKNLRSELAMQL